jgi:hypothetical protein
MTRRNPERTPCRPDPTALPNSFNLAVAVTCELTAQTGRSPADVAKTLADAAALGDVARFESLALLVTWRESPIALCAGVFRLSGAPLD